MSKVRTVFGRSLSVGSNSGGAGENRPYSYDNPAFLRGFHGSRGGHSKSGLPDPKMLDPSMELDDPDGGPEETDLDDESFRSDLERDSAHSSLVQHIHSRQQQQQQQQYQQQQQLLQHQQLSITQQQQQNMAALAHELRYELLQREGNRRASITQWSPTTPGPDSILDPAIHPDQIHFNLQDQRRRSLGSSQGPPPYIPDTRMIGEPGSTSIHDGSELIRKLSGSRIPSSKASVSSPIKFANHPPPSISQSQRMSRRINERAPLQPVVQTSTRSDPSKQPPRRRPPQQQPEIYSKPEKPPARLSNLFGLIDPQKLQSIFGSNGSGNENLPYNPRYARQPQLETIPEVSDSRRGSGDGETVGQHQPISPSKMQHLQLEERKAKRVRSSNVLFFGSICSFVAGILLLMSYASPYWLQSWEDTDSPFKNMGLWEFCFYKFRHPDYQFDKLFHGCHALYGDEYRLIREKLLPGWLMVVQLFVTLALITSYVGQGVIVALLLRYPLEIILRFEWHFCGFALVCQGLTAVLLFFSLCIFGGKCWERDWLLYPNYNYVSWSYALVVFSCIGHIIAAVFLFLDLQMAKERKTQNKALIMQMHPPGFSSLHQVGGSGYI